MAAAEHTRSGGLIGLVIGLGTGLAVGRSTLTTFEELALRVFLEIDGDFVGAGDVLSSRIFWKLAAGAGIGALAGYLVGGRLGAPMAGPARVPPPAPTLH